MKKSSSLLVAISIGISCQIGSGWLFACYAAAKFAGSIAILSWIIGAALALFIAFMLAEIATMYHDRGLFARLLSISHHRDFGFVFAISNWLGLVFTISAEPVATIQYLSSISSKLHPYLYSHGDLTNIGVLLVFILLLIYGVLNYWGMRSLSKANGVMATIKICVPVLTSVLLMSSAFHWHNLTVYRHSIAPYGFLHAFSAVITCGIFYSFYGFSSIATFGAELKNPCCSIPIALVTSVLICLVVYVLLQLAFIVSLPTHMIADGWHTLNLNSPLAQLAILLNLNFLAIILYADAVISPSGSGTTYMGTATRMFTGMAEDQQMPAIFTKIHGHYRLSRRSLLVTLASSLIVVFFFRNWKNVVTLTSVFYTLSCLSVPIGFAKLRNIKLKQALFRLPCGKTISISLFVILSYLLIQVDGFTIMLSLLLHIVLFIIYMLSFYRHNLVKITQSFFSAWSIFVYLCFATLFSYLRQWGYFHGWLWMVFVLTTVMLYFAMIYQKSYVVTEDYLC